MGGKEEKKAREFPNTLFPPEGPPLPVLMVREKGFFFLSPNFSVTVIMFAAAAAAMLPLQ